MEQALVSSLTSQDGRVTPMAELHHHSVRYLYSIDLLSEITDVWLTDQCSVRIFYNNNINAMLYLNMFSTFASLMCVLI